MIRSPGRLMVASSKGGAFRDLMPKLEGHVRGIAWQDADTIVYLADIGVQTTVGQINRDGTGHKVLVPAKVGDVALLQLSLSKDGKERAFVGETSQHPAEVFKPDVKSGLKRSTQVNPWLADIPLVSQEVVEYAARDGRKIQGLLLKPAGYQKGQRYPAIVVVHGGPESHFRNGWITNYSRPGQAGAARGFVMFYPNYRGSTGRGVAFTKEHQADYAGKEFNDLVDGVQFLAKQGLVDTSKVGITGGSYGGYASAWGATALSKHFAASVMFVGISDQISKVGTTDIPNEMYLVHARRWPWKNWDWFRERSPIHHVEKARTPILILHGKEDPRVHPSQSLELYRYLKLLGKVPVRLVLYPGEGHGNRKAAARYDYSLRVLRWMEHYLKGSGGDPPPFKLDYGIDMDKQEGPVDADSNTKSGD